MALLVVGLVVFIGIHLLPSFPAPRQSLIARFGEGPYKGLFALVATLGFVLIVIGMGRAEFVPLWQPVAWGRSAALLLMPLAFILLVAAYVPSNIKRLTAHPMLWAVVVWAAAHLLANGDLAALLLFGGFGAYALFDIWSANRRGARRAWSSRALIWDAAVTGIGLSAYLLILWLHPVLFGVPVLAAS